MIHVRSSHKRSVMQKWKVQPSELALKSSNPITEFTLRLFNQYSEKPIIDLTKESLCAPSRQLINTLVQTIREGKHNGYAPAVGFQETRSAILNYLKYPLEPKDVILSSGASSCLDIAITALADRGQNIIIPKPGPPQFRLLAHGLGIETKEYELVPGTWETDLIDLELKIDVETCAILINNPHNPTGVQYDSVHLKAIINIAAKHKLPIILDETYKDLVHGDSVCESIIEINSKVPMLICGGLGKAFMVSGWRVGWILIHDPVAGFEDVRKALVSLSQRIIGCNTMVQGAIAQICSQEVTEENRQRYLGQVAMNWKCLYEESKAFRGIQINYCCKSIFAFMQINLSMFSTFVSSTDEFCCKLYQEQGILLLPGEIFRVNGFARVILDIGHEDFLEFLRRLKRFCDLHSSH